ncbi:MAG: AMP-binding protein [Myxococcota bacterium]
MNGTLHGLLIDAARQHPRRTAIAWKDVVITYEELLRHVKQLAQAWTLLGLRAGDTVALVQGRGPDAITALYTASWLGCPYAPLDPSWPIRRLRQTLTTLRPQAWVCTRPLRDALDGTALFKDTPPIQLTMQGSESEAAPPPAGEPEAPAYILFTSGSTGTPKGVVHSHASALAFVDWAVEEVGVKPTDRLGGHAALSFDLSTFDVFAACAAGAALVPIPDAIRFRGALLAQFIEREQLSVMYSVPTAWTPVLNAGMSTALRSLRTVLFAGESFPLPDLRRLREQAPKARLLNLYGPTETNVVTWHEVTDADLLTGASLDVIGRPCRGARLIIASSEGEGGERGELHIEGPTMMIGYHQQAPQEGPYATGDHVRRRPDGALLFRGRRDGQIKIRGHRLEVGDVEAACLRAEHTSRVAVIPVMNGHRVTALIAYVSPQQVKPESVLAQCRALLPAYAVPTNVVCVDELPLTPNGKVDRDTLRTRHTSS